MFESMSDSDRRQRVEAKRHLGLALAALLERPAEQLPERVQLVANVSMASEKGKCSKDLGAYVVTITQELLRSSTTDSVSFGERCHRGPKIVVLQYCRVSTRRDIQPLGIVANYADN
jgi:hypothetical protein